MIPEEQPLIAAAAIGIDGEREARRSFWLTHLRIGFSIFVAETLVVAAYLGVTPNGPHRSTLWLVIASWFVFGMSGLLLAPAVASKS
jgi:hypothetical protein